MDGEREISNFECHLSLNLFHFSKECRNQGRFTSTDMTNYCNKASVMNMEVNTEDGEERE